ncbi:MAG: hypothetical protein KF744_11350 [Taibaiella sp.]|nr:hypothetical protein [Taibaiella sp.]
MDNEISICAFAMCMSAVRDTKVSQLKGFMGDWCQLWGREGAVLSTDISRRGCAPGYALAQCDKPTISHVSLNLS